MVMVVVPGATPTVPAIALSLVKGKKLVEGDVPRAERVQG
jgi:hypothetical protein